MKIKNYTKYLAVSALVLLGACDVEYYDTPNSPSLPPTSTIYNNAVKGMVDNTRDTWFSGRFTLGTMQYWLQTEYGDEDRYVYRPAMENTQNTLYRRAENFRKIIELNTDEKTKLAMSADGPNVNQIATCRVMLAYLFNLMTDTWGDIPYYSYGSTDPDFQALRLSTDAAAKTPKYATQAKIYADILKELKEAAAQMDITKTGFNKGDVIYKGNMTKWRKFANSLRLQIALKIRGVDAALANTHIAEVQAGDLISSNADNAVFTYETVDKNASMMYRAWKVDNRSDFGVSHSFVELLSGRNLVDHALVPTTTNPFLGISDPRLPIYAKPNKDGNYVGMFISESSAQSAIFEWESLPGAAIIDKPDFGEVLMEYAEIQFILSELNSWNQTNYVNGIRASMEKWGVANAAITAYLAAVPVASQENVLTQKYIALYMQPHTSWVEYRRTGFPKTLIMPKKQYSVLEPKSGVYYKYVFTPLVNVTDLPTRMKYPAQEQTLNKVNRDEAVKRLANGDEIFSKLWWDVN